jgi:hypothetical protein
MRLDEAKVEEMRRWAQALRTAGSEETAAAGRAILLLIEELERLSGDLRRVRDQLERIDGASNDELDAGTGERVGSALHDRLQVALGRDSDRSLEILPEPVEETRPSAGTEGENTSARSWIEALRRQK